MYEMKSFLLLLALGLVTCDKLDRTYLPPPGSNQAGGSPGEIQTPFEYPKESYQTTSRPFVNTVTSDDQRFYQAENGLPQNIQSIDVPGNELYSPISVAPFNYPLQPFNLPTTTTSYAFTQTTTFPQNEGFETTINPFIPLENGPTFNQVQNSYTSEPSYEEFQHSQAIGQNLAFQSNPSNQVPDFVQNIQADFPQQQPMVNLSQPYNGNQYLAHQQSPEFVSQVAFNNKNQNQYPSGQQTAEYFNDQSTFSPSLPSQPVSNSQLYQNQNGNLKYDGLDQFSSPEDNSNQYSESHTSGPASASNISQPDYSSSTSSSFSAYTTHSDDGLTTPMPSQVLENGNKLPVSNYRSFRPRAELDRNAEILSYENVITPEGYTFSYDTSNGIHVDESASTTNGVKAQGSYSYIGDDGKEYSVIYTADENGFQPRGDHLPTPPPIPEAIKRVIEQAARDKEAGIIDNGSYDESKYGHKNYETGSNTESQEILKNNMNNIVNLRLDKHVQETLLSPSNQDAQINIKNNEIERKHQNSILGQNPMDFKQYNPGPKGFTAQNENLNGYSNNQNNLHKNAVKQMTEAGYATPNTTFNGKIVDQLDTFTQVESGQNAPTNQYQINKIKRPQFLHPTKANFGSAQNQPQPSQVNARPVLVLQNEESKTKDADDINGVNPQQKSPNLSSSNNVLSHSQHSLNPGQESPEKINNRVTTAMSQTPNDKFFLKNDHHKQLTRPSSTTNYYNIEKKPISVSPNSNTNDKFNQISQVYPYQEKQHVLPYSNPFVNNNQFQFQHSNSPGSQNLPKPAENNDRRINSKDFNSNVIGTHKPQVTNVDKNANRTNVFKPSEGYQYISPENKFSREKINSDASRLPSVAYKHAPLERTSSFSDKHTPSFVTPNDKNGKFMEKGAEKVQPFHMQKQVQYGNDFYDKDYEYLEEDDQGKPSDEIVKSIADIPKVTTITPEFTHTSQPISPTRISQKNDNNNRFSGNLGYSNKPNANYVPSTTSFPSRLRTTVLARPEEISHQFSSTTSISKSDSITSSPSPTLIQRGSGLPPRSNIRKPQQRVPTSSYRSQYDTNVATPEFGMKILPVNVKPNQRINHFEQVNHKYDVPNSKQNLGIVKSVNANTQLPKASRPFSEINYSYRHPSGSVNKPHENIQLFSDDEPSDQMIGEDFSGPKQPQKFNPGTGYHY